MSMTLMQYAAQYDSGIQGLAKIISGTSVFMELCLVEKVDGLTHRYGTLTYEGAVATRSLNNPFPETKGSTVDPGSERIIIAGAQAKTDIRMERARPDEIARRQRAVSRFIDAQILRGEGKKDQTRLIGLRDALPAAQQIPAGDNGAALSLDLFHALLDAVEDQGAGRFVLMNRSCQRALKDLILAKAGGASVADFTGTVGQYEGVKLVVAGKDHDGEELLDFDETQGSDEATASMYCIAPGTSELRTGFKLLMASAGIQLVPEGIRDSQFVDGIEVAFGRAVYHPRAAARLKGIQKPTTQAA
jgi:hypothetical protein